MLQKAKTHAIPLGNHVTQQKLTETGSFRYIPVYLGVIRPHSDVIPARSGIFRYHSCSFGFIPAYSGLFQYIPFRSVPVFSNARHQMRQIDNYKRNQWQLRNHALPW